MRVSAAPLLLIPSAAWMISCASAPAPAVIRWTNESDALATITARAASVERVSAACAVTLDDPDRGRVTLEGALVSRLPDHLRLQCWKLSRKVIDLTAIPAGVWLETPQDDEHAENIEMSLFADGWLAEAWALATGSILDRDGVTVRDDGEPTFEARVPLADPPRTVFYTIERTTLTPIACRVLDVDGRERFAMTLERYRLIDGIAWPTRITGTGEQHRFELRLSDVELNGELPNAAFTPPAGAVQRS
ncbi:MAG: LolA-like protein [Planctomycetota bacterium]